ncbi:DUF1559 family PulG-like putative transporter [Paludisphaera soli]|uniref:DUF1559 family PulG-like putative transporter n=1 Tax=Paludisphaera soli TaxID=2712865 RepID=UPI0013EC7977|nr:DUF1559 domain-containing protein [Paludisphaera soli]
MRRTSGNEGGRPLRGFTLIELLVAVFLVGVLAALAIAGAQSVRARARRAGCLTHLVQISLAMHNYLQAAGSFPPIMLGRPNGAGGEAYSHLVSASTRLLPHLGQAPLYHSVNFDRSRPSPIDLDLNFTAMTTTVAAFLCPDDARATVPGYGRNGYRFSVGPTAMGGPDPVDSAWDSGAFSGSKTYRPADFADGLSNTIGVSERLQGDWTRGPFRRGGDYLGPPGPGFGSNRSADQAVALCSGLREPEAIADSRGGETWFYTGYAFTLYNHCATPNGAVPDCVLELTPDTLHGRSLREGVMSATSLHSGGVNVAFMDGSVRFVRDAIHLAAWRALGTRSGGEAVPAE